ncbi:MAG: glycoside hydrolase family 5 protein [Fibromonadaceae bacterium]|jgi:aryl-phospho-beta-D-glucosidase BglC (GH1 family)|nr:glycoside hydrolase family 5 protein [Fibromonadaceae bacterium]
MKKYLCLIAVFLFSCTSEIESADSILEKFLNASLNEESSSNSENYESNSSQGNVNNSGSSNRSSSSNKLSSSGGASSSSGAGNSNPSSSGTTIISPSNGGPVSYYGRLKASGNKIVGSKTGSTAVQVRGVSLFWSNTGWGGDKFFTETTVNAMVDDWKAEVIRVPMGHSIPGKSQYSGSYLADKAKNMARVKTAIDAAIAKDVYVIIDWHSHSAHVDPDNAIEFFTAMAQEYGSKDHVIFEIYNEPKCANGADDDWCVAGNWTTWAQIKAYANTIIPVIRSNGGANSLILVGTPYFSAAVGEAATSFLTDNNVGYVFHFYAQSHTINDDAPPWNGYTYSSGVKRVLDAGKPVFITEYGTTNADGGGGSNYNSHDAASSNAWHTFMDNNKISSCAWSINDKREGSSFFGTGSTFNMSNWTNTSSMTASGQYIFNKLRTYANSASWRSGSGGGSSSSGGGGSSTRCKDAQGRDYFCQWGSGCFAIDPAFDEDGAFSKSCTRMVNDCRDWGRLYINSTIEGEDEICDGTAVN